MKKQLIVLGIIGLMLISIATKAETVKQDNVSHVTVEISGSYLEMIVTSDGNHIVIAMPYREEIKTYGATTYSGQESSILIYSIPQDMSNEPITSMKIKTNDITALGVTTSNQFAIVDEHDTLTFYDVTGTVIRNIEGVETFESDWPIIRRMSFNDTGSLMLIPNCITAENNSCTQRGIDLWDSLENEIIRSQVIHENPRVLLRPDGQIIASATSHGVQFWDSQTGRLLNTYFNTAPVYYYDMAFSPDGNRLLYSTCQLNKLGKCTDSQITIINTATFEVLYEMIDLEHTASTVAYSPSGTMWASASSLYYDDTANNISVYDAETNERLYTLGEEYFVISDIAFVGEDERTLVSLGHHVGSDSPIAYMTFWQLGTTE